MLNKAMIIGRVGKDPDVNITKNGRAVAKLSIATNEKWRNKEGEWQESTEWHNVTCWGKLAEICGEYVGKGTTVYIEGSIKTDEVIQEDGSKRYYSGIKAHTMKFIGNGPGTKRNTEQPELGATDDPDDIPF